MQLYCCFHTNILISIKKKQNKVLMCEVGIDGCIYIQSRKILYHECNTLGDIIFCFNCLSLIALQPSLQLVYIHARMNLIKRDLSLSFRGHDIPCFDAGSHKSYISSCSCTLQEPIIIIRLSQPLTIEEETGDRSEVYLALDFHFQYIAWLLLWWLYADN